MAGYKGVGVVFVRQQIRAARNVEPEVVAGLSDDERALYTSAVATDWVPIEFVTKLFTLAAPLLYPDDGSPLRRLSRDLATNDLHGIYRFVVRVLTVPSLVGQTATLWARYHAKGTASSFQPATNAAIFEVAGYPELPERFRESLCGWIAQATEMTGAQGVRVVKGDADPQRWTWKITWR